MRIDLGEVLPESALAYSGLVFMGGPMSVNDDLPWIEPALNLIREAVAADIPVLGHCLGGQLMSKALGGVVGANPVKEIGWGNVTTSNHAEAKKWFGDAKQFLGFHWHGETFTLPQGSTHLLSSQYCINQAYSIGRHLAFQCHIEMTEEMVKVWCETGKLEVLESVASPGVQSLDEIQQALPERVKTLNQLANTVYREWIKGLRY
ncbi:MAG TPA: glutamine amidotransferase [Methylophilaceae bacterium]|nr:glutamine amidotransferase [Methylophilaceae bacterium]